MESGSEFEREKGITLVSPEDKLDKLGAGEDAPYFRGIKRRIPDLGIAYLDGEAGYAADWYEDNLGMAIIEDQVVVRKASDLASMGLSTIGINVDGPRRETTCRMMLPKYNLDLESELKLFEDDVEEDPEKRYFCASEKWKKRGDDRELYFFGPADPKFLSQLEFSFSQVLNLPQDR